MVHRATPSETWRLALISNLRDVPWNTSIIKVLRLLVGFVKNFSVVSSVDSRHRSVAEKRILVGGFSFQLLRVPEDLNTKAPLIRWGRDRTNQNFVRLSLIVELGKVTMPVARGCGQGERSASYILLAKR
jgi:hypothetical protein